jgi:CheY-like chemotaxis protein
MIGVRSLDPPKVFVSYSHDSEEHCRYVLEVANRLRSDGIDAWIDRYVTAPIEGWPRWMLKQIQEADFVLLVCTATYRRRFEGQEAEGTGRGAVYEGMLVTQILYEASTKSRKFITLLPEHEPESSVPLFLLPFARYRYPSDYENLYGHLTEQPELIAPPLGKLRKRRSPPVQPPRTAERLAGEIGQTGSRILVVDDDKLWRSLVKDALSGLGEGAVFDLAESYPAALHLLSFQRYDLAVIDLALKGHPASREEADELGLNLLAEVRGGPLNRNCAVIVLTGYPSIERSRRALDKYMAFRFLLKAEFERREGDFLAAVRSAILSARLEHADRTEPHCRLEADFDATQIRELTVFGPRGEVVQRNTPPPDPQWPEVMGRALQLNSGDGAGDGQWREEMLALGSDLFRLLLGNGQILTELPAATFADLELRFTAPASGLSLPLELLRGAGEFLVPRHVITRRLAGSGPPTPPESLAELVARTLSTEEPLRIFVVAEERTAAVDREIKLIEESLADGLGRFGLASTCRFAGGDARSLARKVEAARPQILHYVEPGDRDTTTLPHAEELARALSWPAEANPLRFVFLGSGLLAPPALENTIEALAKLGVLAIPGFRWPVSRQSRTEIMATFYRALWKTFSPSRALQAARLACWREEQESGDLDWASPVLMNRNL